MRLLVNRWYPLTHASHCMTTSWPAAATQTRARLSPAMYPKVLLRRMPSCHYPPYFQAWRLAQNMPACIPLGQSKLKQARLTQNQFYVIIQTGYIQHSAPLHRVEMKENNTHIYITHKVTMCIS